MDIDHGVLCVEFREIFAAHDSDSDGWIPLDEMTSVLKGIGVNVTVDDVIQAASANVESSKLCFHSNVQGRRKELESGGDMASAGARAYNGGLGAEPPQRGPGAEPLVRGSGGEAPLKLTPF